MTAAAAHMAVTKHTAGVSEPLRLRKRSGNVLTYADNTVAQPTIVAIPPYRGRTNNTATTQANEKYG